MAAPVLVAQVHLDVVGEVEPALGLDHVGEQRQDVAVLLVQLELHLGFIPLQVFAAHRATVATVAAFTARSPSARS